MKEDKDHLDYELEQIEKVAVLKAEAKKMTTFELLSLRSSLYTQEEIEGIHYEINRFRRQSEEKEANLVIPFEQRASAEIWLIIIKEELKSRKIDETVLGTETTKDIAEFRG